MIWKLLLCLMFLPACSTLAKPKEDMIEVSCITQQLDWYGDLCAESSVGYEDMKGSEAYYYGVRCAVEAALMCGGYESINEEYE